MAELYRVIGTGPDGQQEIGEPRPRDEAMRIFEAVVSRRAECFRPDRGCRVAVVLVGAR